MKSNLLIICAVFAIHFSLSAQDTTTVVPKKIYNTKALNLEKPPVIDGLLNDPSWNLVEWGGDYIEFQPDENTSPTFQTKFKIVYDDKNLYVAFKCYDAEPEKIEQRLSRRDGFSGDWIEINIDSYFDKRTAFSFTVTAAGVKGDEFISNNGNNFDESWNPIWYTRTNIDEEGWTAEMRIPLSQLKFGNEKNQVWGLQSTRRFFREEERSLWQRKPIDTPGWVSEFGEMHGLINLKPQKQLEIQPYTVAKFETFEAEDGNPFRDGNNADVTGGLDAKIGITNDLTLDLTINPDFGQVDADPSRIALDGFQIFFQERRPFFVENNNIFDFNVSRSEAGNTFGADNIFYSRRIGRSPQGFPDTNDGEYVDQPDNTPILGAAKFSGKTKDGWSIGVLESITAKRHATIDSNGDRRREVVEPLTNYMVGRLQKDMNDGDTYIGGMFTATNREDLTDELDFLHKSAYTGGFDFKHQWNDRDWYIGGNLVWSHVKGSEEAIESTQRSITHLFQRVGADHVEVDTTRTSMSGSGGNIQLGKVGDGHWKFETGATWRSPELELNDIGFQRQADDMRHYTWIGYQTLKPDSTFRRVGINYNHWSVWDFDGNHNQLQFNTNSWQNWKNNWFTNIGFNYRPILYSNFALRGGPRLRQSQEFSFWNSINTDSRKKLRFSAFHNGAKAFDDSSAYYSIEAGFSYQPTNALRISAFPSYRINNDKLQFIDNIDVDGTTRYLNGKIEQRTLSMSFRLNYTINPNLTIQYWGQPFISRGRYSEFKHVIDPMAKEFDDRINLYDDNQISIVDGEYFVDEDMNGTSDFSFGDPDFSFIQFRSNLVIRWEYIPGSEIFLVWSQDISQSGDPSEGLLRSLGDNVFGGEKPMNIFLLKATYRFVF
ncbi:carbohydrate binding family 9 domain-containing protein [Muriicola sp. Z0-33]|uniref:carbohydrate binding family 9 domain-containing protein n=1 Tax=Muriicola sp. Z0-33 TaxID=2816957 RepID=UPI002237A592|nr:carbohydrate binding family 9 domain-containing protein [Muriicola sp. Z0-33]MCW5516279.1 carbohydrate binding family 9 domain-containing protein [Muriicola sp. Z0-33]